MCVLSDLSDSFVCFTTLGKDAVQRHYRAHFSICLTGFRTRIPVSSDTKPSSLSCTDIQNTSKMQYYSDGCLERNSKELAVVSFGFSLHVSWVFQGYSSLKTAMLDAELSWAMPAMADMYGCPLLAMGIWFHSCS